MCARRWILIASSLLTLGVMGGAFGAHALRDSLDEYSRGIYEKATFYLFIHALGLFLVVIATQQQLLLPRTGTRAGTLLALGILLFSGSLYLLAITGQRWLGAITPFGGTCFIVAWALVAWDAVRRRT